MSKKEKDGFELEGHEEPPVEKVHLRIVNDSKKGDASDPEATTSTAATTKPRIRDRLKRKPKEPKIREEGYMREAIWTRFLIVVLVAMLFCIADMAFWNNLGLIKDYSEKQNTEETPVVALLPEEEVAPTIPEEEAPLTDSEEVKEAPLPATPKPEEPEEGFLGVAEERPLPPMPPVALQKEEEEPAPSPEGEKVPEEEKTVDLIAKEKLTDPSVIPEEASDEPAVKKPSADPNNSKPDPTPQPAKPADPAHKTGINKHGVSHTNELTPGSKDDTDKLLAREVWTIEQIQTKPIRRIDGSFKEAVAFIWVHQQGFLGNKAFFCQEIYNEQCYKQVKILMQALEQGAKVDFHYDRTRAQQLGVKSKEQLIKMVGKPLTMPAYLVRIEFVNFNTSTLLQAGNTKGDTKSEATLTPTRPKPKVKEQTPLDKDK